MEKLYSDYEVYGYRVTSAGFKKSVLLGVMCPNCEAVLPTIEHSELRVCKCGWPLTRFENILLCTEPVA